MSTTTETPTRTTFAPDGNTVGPTTMIPPAFASRLVRSMGFRLAPEHEDAAHVAAALDRLDAWLRDDGWTVAANGTALAAEKHPGVFYRNLSPMERATRGRLTCWLDRGRLHLAFRPDWLAALVDAGIVAMAFALSRRLASPRVTSYSWVAAGFAGLVNAALLPGVMLLVRIRFAVLLGRAVRATDDVWSGVCGRAIYWRWAWNAALVVAAFPFEARVERYLRLAVSVYWMVARSAYRFQPVASLKLVLYAALYGAGLLAIGYILLPKHNHHARD